MHSLTLTTFLALLACPGDTTDDTGTTDSGTTDSGTTDSGTTDTGDTTDTQDTGDTTDTQPVGDKLTGTLFSPGDGTTGDLAVSLSALIPGDEMFDLGDTLVATVSQVDGAWSMPLDEPAADLLFEADPEHYPGTMVWLGAAVAFVDDDSSGTLEPGEGLLGMNLEFLVGYVTGTIPTGWSEGWALLDMATMDQKGGPDFLPIDPLEITLRGQPVLELGLGGTWTPGGPPGAQPETGLAMVTLDETMAPDLEVVLADLNPLTSPWALDLSGAPSTTYTLSDGGDGGPVMIGAYGLALTYRDVDASGAYNPGDGLGGQTMCSSTGDPVLTLWLEPPTDVSGLMMLEMLQYNAGWTPLQWMDKRDGPPAVLDPAELLNLHIDADCTIGG